MRSKATIHCLNYPAESVNSSDFTTELSYVLTTLSWLWLWNPIESSFSSLGGSIITSRSKKALSFSQHSKFIVYERWVASLLSPSLLQVYREASMYHQQHSHTILLTNASVHAEELFESCFSSPVIIKSPEWAFFHPRPFVSIKELIQLLILCRIPRDHDLFYAIWYLRC